MHAARLSNIQWYLNRSHHIAYMAFLIPAPVTPGEATDLMHSLMEVFPRLACAVDLSKSEDFQAAGVAPGDRLDERAPQNHKAALAQLLAQLTTPFTPGLKPAFHCSMVPSVDGDSTLLFFSAPHAAIEGIDTLHLDSKNRTMAAKSPGAVFKRALIALLALPVAVVQLGFAPLSARPLHLFSRRIVSVDRQAFRTLARNNGVSWQGLLLACLVNSGGQTRGARLRLPRLIAITEVPKMRSGLDDHSIRFRLRLGLLRPAPDLFRLATRCDRHLRPAARRSVAPYHVITAGLPFHRKLAAWLPLLYPARSFQYFPAELSFSVMPPIRAHRFGKLGKASVVVSGSNTPALTSCIATNARGRLYLSLNLPGDGAREISALGAQLAALGLEVDVLV